MKWIFLLASLAPMAPAQTPVLLSQLTQLREYLQLNDNQLQSIEQNLTNFVKSSSDRYARIFQVRGEIAEQTAKDVLDPLGLGLRYAEIETRCRQIRTDETALAAKNAALLTDPQRARLKALEDFIKEAARLGPVIGQAQFARLLAGAGSVGIGIIVQDPYPGFGYANFLLGSYPLSADGCQQSAFRSGDFVPAPLGAGVAR
jgi:hypothetical protein